MIIKESRGIPRLMNIICDNALITGFGYQKRPVGQKILKEVLVDLLVRQKPSRLRRWVVAALLLVVLGILLYFAVHYWKALIGENRVQVSPQNATSNLVHETSRKEDLPQVEPGNHTRNAQTTTGTTMGEVSPKKDEPVEASSPGQSEDNASRQGGDDREAVPAAKMNGGPSPAVAPVETVPPATPSAHPLAASGPLVSNPEPVKDTAKPTRKSVRKTVKRGDTLSKLATEVYGYSDPEIIAMLHKHNPHIKNPNKILIGDEVLFPELDGTGHAH